MTGTRGALAANVGKFLARKTSRRGVLQRGAIASSALAVAPSAYVLRPTSAYAAVCARGSLCNDGYTEFCCTIYGTNKCPPGTLLGGWWKVDGSSFCGGGPRYYMDCNGRCGSCGCGSSGVCSNSCSNTVCGCAQGKCSNRKAGCTKFRYGQCNNQIACLGPIVCRVVTCTEPWRLDGSCSQAVRTDNATRYHNRPCLQVDATGQTTKVDGIAAGVRVSGWALDPATSAAATVTVYSCLKPIASFAANKPSPQIESYFPNLGTNHGFDEFLRLCPGEQLISIAVSDTSGNGSTWLSHDMVTVDGAAFAHLDVPTTGPAPSGADTGSIRVTGFAVEPVFGQPYDIKISRDGEHISTVRATTPRADVATAYPHLGGNFGFDATIPGTSGSHQVCVEALDADGNVAVDLGCRTVVVPWNPLGVIESVVSPGPGFARIVGWAKDNDADEPLQVNVTVDGVDAGVFRANANRSDDKTGYGFDISISDLDPGSREVCVTAYNKRGGNHTNLGCEIVAVTAATTGAIRSIEPASDGFTIVSDPFMRMDGTTASLRVLVDGNYVGLMKPTEPLTTKQFPLAPGTHEIQVVSTIDGAGSVPVQVGSAQIEVGS